MVITLQCFDAEEVEQVGFHGSPSILINVVDVFADDSAAVGLTYRRYMTDKGAAGAATLEQIRAALPVG